MRGEGDRGAVSNAVPGVGGAAHEAPPRVNELEPGGPHRNEDLAHARVRRQPVADGATGVTRERVGDEIEVAVGMVAVGMVAVDGAEQVQIARGMACGRGLGADLSITDAPCALDPGFVVAAVVAAAGDEGGGDPMAIPRPPPTTPEPAGRPAGV